MRGCPVKVATKRSLGDNYPGNPGALKVRHPPHSRPAPLPPTRNLFLNPSSNTLGGKANKPGTKIFLRRR